MGLQSVKPDATNPHFKSRFTTLDAIWDAIRQPLADAGLAVSQGVDRGANDQPYFYTLLLHTSGEWLRSEMPLLLDKQTAQGILVNFAISHSWACSAVVVCGSMRSLGIWSRQSPSVHLSSTMH